MDSHSHERVGSGADSGTISEPVTICMCTFRRPSVFDALESFRKLAGSDHADITVVISDNDETDKLRPQIEEFARSFPFALHYVHAPAKNISIARNAALNAVSTRWAAFVDDDEIATSQWLLRLMERRYDGAAVVGRCEAVYGPELPDWVARSDFHSNRITGDVANAYTSNVLLDMDFIRNHGLAFRPELGKTGGEDTIFFRELERAGGRIVYEPNAVVFENVPSGRANMSWVLKRKYRAGQTHGLLCSEFDRDAFSKLFFTAGGKAFFSLGMALVKIPGSVSSRRWIARAAMHAGAVHYRLNPHILREYG